MTAQTRKILEEFFEVGEMSSKKFKNSSLLNILKEHKIVTINQVGKTRSMVKLLDKKYFIDFLKVEFSVDITQTWSQVVEDSSLESGLKEALIAKPIEIRTKSYQEIVQNIVMRRDFIQKGMTNRQISAILFWGLSKELDSRKDIVHILEGNSPEVMLNVCSASHDFSEILFIENYDTYVDYISKKKLKDTLIVYSAGFSTSALRIREKDGCSLHYSNQDKLDMSSRHRFESWLYKESQEPINISFFGDFDFAGVSILSALRKIFPSITMHKKAYDSMLEEVTNGNAHSPEMASKEHQKDPHKINDSYCDDVLLPAMREHGFYDQEGVVFF